MTKHPRSYWSDHLAEALLLLQHTASRATWLAPITMLTARRPIVPPTLLPQLPQIPDEPTAEEEHQYYEAVSSQLDRLHRLGGQHMQAEEAKLRGVQRQIEGGDIQPTTWFFFNEGDAVLRRQRAFNKIDAKATGPFVVTWVGGTYRQKVTIKPFKGNGRTVTVHASNIVPFAKPYVEPHDFDVAVDVEQPMAAQPPLATQPAGRHTQHKKRKVGD